MRLTANGGDAIDGERWRSDRRRTVAMRSTANGGDPIDGERWRCGRRRTVVMQSTANERGTVAIWCGYVTVDISVLESTRFLVLNSIDLVIKESYYTDSSNHKVGPSETVVDKDDETIVLVFYEALGVSDGVLEIKFSGVLNEHMKGFYKGTYVDGVRKKMAVTQFEPADARRCFPCWDEPALKACDVSLTGRNTEVSLTGRNTEVSLTVRNTKVSLTGRNTKVSLTGRNTKTCASFFSLEIDASLVETASDSSSFGG
ncbi:aminopeptidase M1-like protein isoform X1 [Tanacetum coccineum]